MTLVDITAPSVLRKVHKDVRPVVKAAAMMGWTGRRSGSGGLVLYAPDGHNMVRIPITINHGGVPKALARDIVKFTPEHLREAMADHVLEHGSDQEARDAADLVRTAAGAFGPAVVSGIESVSIPEIPDLETIEPAVTIVSSEPWMARVSSDGRKTDLYPSQATLERTWSDGSVDYACAWEGCDYTADKPRSTSSHYRIHVMDSGVRADTTPTVFDAKVDGYRTVRVAHLAKEIEAALDSIEDGSVYDTTLDGNGGLARYLATQIIRERLAKGKEKIEDDEPTEPEDILARIKRLVMREENKRAEQAEAHAENLRKQVEEITAERDQARDRWQALRELISDG